MNKPINGQIKTEEADELTNHCEHMISLATFANDDAGIYVMCVSCDKQLARFGVLAVDDRYDIEELRILRQSLAGLAQKLGAQTIQLPVITRPSLQDIVNMSKAKRRGWNALAAATLGKIEEREEAARLTIKNVVNLCLEWLKYDADTKIKHTVDMLYAIMDIIPPKLHKLYKSTVIEVEGGNAYDTGLYNLNMVLKWIEREECGLND